jgi:hypothetical protein
MAVLADERLYGLVAAERAAVTPRREAFSCELRVPDFSGTGRPCLIGARILIVDGDKLLLEFDVPDGMTVEMPGRGTPLALADRPDPAALRRSHDRLQLIEPDSTHPSTYDAGLTLRLALEGPDWKRRLAAGPLFVAWESGDWLIVLAIE